MRTEILSVLLAAVYPTAIASVHRRKRGREGKKERGREWREGESGGRQGGRKGHVFM